MRETKRLTTDFLKSVTRYFLKPVTRVLEIPIAQLRSLAQSHSSLQRVLILALQERAGLSGAEITALAARQGVDISVSEIFLDGGPDSAR